MGQSYLGAGVYDLVRVGANDGGAVSALDTLHMHLALADADELGHRLAAHGAPVKSDRSCQ